MNPIRISLFVALGVLLFGAGCGSIDLSTGGSPDRVLNGTVTAGVALPTDAEIVVRVVAPVSTSDTPALKSSDIPVATRSSAQSNDRVLGEQTQRLAAGTTDPVPFRVEYNADDATLRRGLNVEVRISVAGKVRFRTVNSHVVTLASSPFPQDVAVQPTGGN